MVKQLCKTYNYRCKKDISFLNLKFKREILHEKDKIFSTSTRSCSYAGRAAYAYWTQDLTINTTVNTGELEAIFKSLQMLLGE